jgi:hypothetical protein
MKPGDRIRLVEMLNDPDPLPVGATGTIQDIVRLDADAEQWWIKWDAPNERRSLSLVVPPDRVEQIVEEPRAKLVHVTAYAHKLTDMALKETDDDAWVSRVTDHPTLGKCYVGSFLTGIGLFNVHFPVDAVRVLDRLQRAEYLGRTYGGAGRRPWKLRSEHLATQNDLDALPLVPWSQL